MAGDRHAELPRLWTRLYGYALSLVSDDERARDLVQETAVRAMGARAVPDEPAAYRAWLFRILRNALTDELRRHRRRSEPEPGPVDVWRFDEARIARITVQQGLAALPVHHREIIALIDIVGFSYAEAAAQLDIPQGTVMSRISRARQALLGVIQSSSVHPLKRHHGN